MSSDQHVRLRVLAALVALAAAWFAYRGPVRALREGNYDAALVYASARAWLTGHNPYVGADASSAWRAAGGPIERDPMSTRAQAVLLYPPATFVALAPVAALPWNTAEIAWTAMNAALWVLTLAWSARLAGLTWGSTAGRTYWALGLAFAPAHTCVAHGQTAVLAVACAAAGVLLAARGRGAWAGVLLALGAAVKPQVAALYIVHQAGRRRWLVAGVAVAAVGVIFALGAWRMSSAGVAWSPAWKGNLDAFTSLDDGNPTSTNPLRFQLINLQYLLHTFTDDAGFVRWATVGIVAGLCAAYFAADLGRSTRRGDLSALAMVGVASLLVTYHRAYDAAILVFALAWALAVLGDAEAGGNARRWAWAALACVLVFMVPGASALNAVQGRLPAWLTGSWAWESLVMPHAVWALLGLGGVLIASRAGEARSAETPA
ncbi:MAG: hypothetical protein HBSAPP03_08990 [Phycisphaerae bacterium]|nr:MAG: hypothetical protein HBSAPP03_08990 [Phycisphaerae bacterium]